MKARLHDCLGGVKAFLQKMQKNLFSLSEKLLLTKI